MKILIIGGDPLETGGIASFDRNLLSFFSEYDITYLAMFNGTPLMKTEHEDKIIRNSRISKDGNFKIIRKYVRYVPYFFTQKLKKVNINEYDCIILNIPFYIKFLKNYDGKIIIPVHQEIDLWLKQRIYYGFENKDKINKLFESKNVIFVTSSNKSQSTLMEKFPLNKVEKIYYSTPLEEKYKTEKTKKIIMIARYDIKSKRFDLAMEVMKYLPDYELIIKGVGPDENKIQNLAASYPNVSERGFSYSTQEDFKDVSFYINVSEYEGFPITAVEAIQNGVIPIVRNSFIASKELTHIDLVVNDNPKNIAETIKKAYENYSFYYNFIIEYRKQFSTSYVKDEWIKLIEQDIVN